MPWLLNRILLMCSLLAVLTHAIANGQTMQGQIFDAADNKPLEQVVIINIVTSSDILTDRQGKFLVDARAGQLIEFRKEGYKVIRVRVPQGKLPPFFKVVMERYDPSVPHFENSASPDYKSDSIKYARLYRKELEFPQMTTLDVINHPFSAMSKKNQQVWAFQKQYAAYQEQKYIDYVFSTDRITTLTGLYGDSLYIYRQLFRPSYSQLRNMNEYTFLNYIKRTVAAYRQRGVRSRQSNTRLTR